MQEEILKIILVALENGAALSRKVLVIKKNFLMRIQANILDFLLFFQVKLVVKVVEAQFPQGSKTCVGHVVQLLYRASCFNVS